MNGQTSSINVGTLADIAAKTYETLATNVNREAVNSQLFLHKIRLVCALRVTHEDDVLAGQT